MEDCPTLSWDEALIFIFKLEKKKRQSQFFQVMFMYKGRNFSGGGEI